MRIYFVLIVLLSSGCFAQDSKYVEPCKEKIIAYSGGVTPLRFNDFVQQCVTISEYYEKQRKQQKAKNEFQKNIDEGKLLLKIDRIMKAKGLTDKDLASCGVDISNPNAEQTNEELDQVALCLSMKK